MDIIDLRLQEYAEQYTTPENTVLARINRDTHAKILRPRMLSGHLQGRLLSMISHMIRPRYILEIGTYTAYSTICLAEGLRAGGKIITIDINEELEERVINNITMAGLRDVVDYRIGDAGTIIPSLDVMFDLVFIDADKENYTRYLEMVTDKVNLNGFILADNVLWSGKVLDVKPDKDTRAIQEFNRKVKEDPRMEHILLPLRDGIMLIRKVSL